MFKKSITALVLVAATAATVVPAAAQQISFDLNAQTQEEADLIRGGLVLYQLANGGDPVEVLTQAAQGGAIGVIHQEGNGHNNSLAQGQGDSGAIFAFGNGTNAHLNQDGGPGEGNVRFVLGW